MDSFLADDTAELLEQMPRPGFLAGIVQPLGRVGGGADAQGRGEGGGQGAAAAHSAGSSAARTAARRGRANLSRRSDSEIAPPRAMMIGPKKISRAQGLK